MSNLARWEKNKKKPRIVLGVSTFNRLHYLQKFVETFDKSREDEFDWVLIVADDGSSDGTVDYLLDLSLPDVLIVKIFNKRAGIAGQTNSILLAAEAVNFDFGLKCDDDVYFVRRGWASGYLEAAKSSGFDHLVHHDDSWKKGAFRHVKGPLEARVGAEDSMGCLWTFTPRLVEDVGYFDERSFPVRGHSHIDYTCRSSRLGYNEAETIWNWSGSSHHIGMWPKADYVRTADLRSSDWQPELSPEKLRVRQELIADDDRTYCSFDPLPTRPLPVVDCGEDDPDLLSALAVRGFAFRARAQFELYDEAFVLNLPHHFARWRSTASALSKAGISFRRAKTVNGYQPDVRAQWEQYASTGLDHPHEKRIGRKLIQTPGAWGYLSSAAAVVDEARSNRYGRVLMFDDDITLHEDFDRKIDQLLGELPDDWKLLYLGASYDDLSRLERLSDHTVDPGERVNGSFAVAFTAACFELLEQSISDRTWPFDSGPLREIRGQFPKQVLAARPELVLPDVSVSSIREPRDHGQFAEKMGWDTTEFSAGTRSPGPRVVLLIWAGRDPVALRETMRSVRFQHFGWFEVVVVTNNQWVESCEAASEALRQDSRVSVIGVDTSDSIFGLGIAESHVRDASVLHMFAGDVLFPNHLSVLVELLEVGEVAVPSAIPAPPNARFAGQLGVSWQTVRDYLASAFGFERRATRAIFSNAARETVGDLRSWDDDLTERVLSKSFGGSPFESKDPTMIAVPALNTARSDFDVASPFFLSPGRSVQGVLRPPPE
jgi:glycosyltransferase involved in cell wall biosynthesis